MRLDRATQDAVGSDIPPGFPILSRETGGLHRPAQLFLIETWLSGSVTSLETVRTYAEALYDLFQFFEDNAIDERFVTKKDLRTYRARMLSVPGGVAGQAYSRRTINQRIRTAEAYYKFLQRRGLVRALPFPYRKQRVVKQNARDRMAHLDHRGPTIERNTLLVSAPKPDPKLMDAEEVRAILNSLDVVSGAADERPSRERLMAETVLVTGSRRFEICNLLLDQIPEAEGNEKGTCELILTITKGGKPRAVYPPWRFIERLNWYIRLDRSKITSRSRKAPPQLFITHYGTPVDPDWLSTRFRRATQMAHIRTRFHRPTLHWFRHDFAIRMFRELERKPGVNPWKTLQRLLGHSSVLVTMDTYLDAVGGDEAAITDSVEALYDAVIN